MLELWGGVECTINRVHDGYMTQLDRSGHLYRLSDFDCFAALGIRKIRQPILWEMVAKNSDCKDYDWTWPDLAVKQIQKSGMGLIAGLLHHGSGPKDTNLLDPEFPQKFAQYAFSVAERFPWIEEYTPINEPLTTARFSGLYGHWYPHARDELSFLRALLNQCKAVVLSMRAIREVQPMARLIQTEDLGHVFSTPRLAYQAKFENERRWLTFDLLFGRVDRSHPMWGHMEWAGIDFSELAWFLENPCPPETIGINHYLSGQRFLDEHLERYPAEAHGGNGNQRYADVLAARVLESGAMALDSLFVQVWERYGQPMAITESHNACTREEQMRWFVEVWHAAKMAHARGADVRAVTAWSLLGAFDWDRLVTEKRDFYEIGAFDIQSGQPKETATAHLLSYLARGDELAHPLLGVPGWWKRPDRYIYGFSLDKAGFPSKNAECPVSKKTPFIALHGPNGRLKTMLLDACQRRGIGCEDLKVNGDFDDNAVENIAGTLGVSAVLHMPSALDVKSDRQDEDDCRIVLGLSSRVGTNMNVSFIEYSIAEFSHYDTKNIDAQETWFVDDTIIGVVNKILDFVVDQHVEWFIQARLVPQAAG